MTDFTDRDLYLAKKALRDHLVASNGDLVLCSSFARIAVTGEPG